MILANQIWRDEQQLIESAGLTKLHLFDALTEPNMDQTQAERIIRQRTEFLAHLELSPSILSPSFDVRKDVGQVEMTSDNFDSR